MTVWIYDQGEELKVFATEDAARAWIRDPHPHSLAHMRARAWSAATECPEGVAFEYEVVGPQA
jgi:hypothetical protein